MSGLCAHTSPQASWQRCVWLPTPCLSFLFQVYGEEALPIPDSVHDVQLGGDLADATAPAAPGAVSRHAASGLPPPHLASQRVPADADHETASFAAALAGGRTRLAEESSAAKLQFSMGRRVLERHMTIFQAIQAQAQAAEEDADEDDAREADVLLPTSGRRLWDAVYTISYATAPPQPPAAAAVAGDATPNDAPAGPSAGAGEVGAGSPLDVVRAPWLPEEVAPSRRAVREVLELLRLLEALSQLVPRMRAEAAADAVAEGRHATLQEAVREQQVRSIVRIEEFLSTKITPKLTRQMQVRLPLLLRFGRSLHVTFPAAAAALALGDNRTDSFADAVWHVACAQDALALCSGSLPPWVHHLTAACPFLFPFEARRQYFHATAFGLSRALQRLQAQQSSDGAPVALDRDGREVRVGRLQRQKVRVSRQRILESAAKVFELYAAHKAVLEVEYFGEVGTGLGPTLEFYTLLSHELQKKHLQLWRADGPALPDPKMADAPLDSDADLMDLDDPAPPGERQQAPRVRPLSLHTPAPLFWHPGSQHPCRLSTARLCVGWPFAARPPLFSFSRNAHLARCPARGRPQRCARWLPVGVCGVVLRACPARPVPAAAGAGGPRRGAAARGGPLPPAGPRHGQGAAGQPHARPPTRTRLLQARPRTGGPAPTSRAQPLWRRCHVVTHAACRLVCWVCACVWCVPG